MANNSLQLVALDFDAFKNSLKNYLRNNEQFKDIDFEASNISMLLDVLAYNTYHNAFYLNMIGSEMFMDTAQIRESIVSHAKDLNYLPRSVRSSRAVINMSYTPGTYMESFTALKGTAFKTNNGRETYYFCIPNNLSFTAVANTSTGLNAFYANNVEIFEGRYVVDTFVVDESNENQKFVISNRNVDTSSITVNVVEDGSAQLVQYRPARSLLNIAQNAPVFFIQGTDNNQYEIVFGNNVFGRKPKNGAIVTCEYRASAGEKPNGAVRFELIDNIQNVPTNNVNITVVQAARYGGDAETVQSIKYNAPRYFQTQERAVTARDYTALLKSEFPEIDSVHVYGGEEADPPKFGKVIVVVDAFDADGIPRLDIERYRKFLKEKTPLTIDPEFIPPSFLDCIITSHVVYNLNTSSARLEDIKAGVKNTILTFCQENINDFNTTLRMSRLVSAIDNTYQGIVSNDTRVKLRKVFTPTGEQILLRRPFTAKINFFNPISDVRSDNFSFIYLNVTYPNTYLIDNGEGIINAVLNGKPSPIGSVDYSTGVVTLDNLSVATYIGDGINFTATPSISDITVRRNDILQARSSDIVVEVEGKYL